MSTTERSVTVLVTTGNDGPFLAAAVDSALAQPEAAEVLVLDDGSVDDGPAVLARLSDPRVRIVCQPRYGVAHLLNLGLALARTSHVVLLAARDVLHSGCVAALLAALEREPDALAVLVAARRRDPSGAELGESAPAPDPSLRAVLASDVPPLSGVLLDRARALAAGGIDPSLRHAYAQDLWLRLALHGRAVVVPERLVDVTVRGGPVSSADARAEEIERARVLLRALSGTRLEELLVRLAPRDLPAPEAEAAACLELARVVVRGGVRAALGVAAELVARACALGATVADDAELAPLRALHPGLATPRALDAGAAGHTHAPAPGVASAVAAPARPDAQDAATGGLRIALEVATLDRGGLETVVHDLALALRDAGHVPTVLCTEGGGARAEQLRARGVEVVVLRGPDREAELARVLATRGVELVNAHFSTFGSRVAARLGIPVVSTLHNAYAWLGAGVLDAIRATDEVIDGYVAVSQSVAEFCAERFALERERIVVIRNCVTPRPASSEDRSAARRALGIGDDAQLLVQVGRLDPIKCQLALVEALRLLASERPRVVAWLVGGVGNPAYAHRIEARIAAAGLADRVTLAGERDDVARILAAADVFVMPSVLEGLSLAAIEAMAAGVPAVLTRTGDAAFLLGEGGARGDAAVLPGALVDGPAFPVHVDSEALNALAASEEPPHARDLARAIAEVLDDLPRRSARARERAAELAQELSHERWLAAHVELFERVATSGAAHRQRALATVARRCIEQVEEERRAGRALEGTLDALARMLLNAVANERAAALVQRTRTDLATARFALADTFSLLARALDKLRIGHRIRTALEGFARRSRGDAAR